MLHFFTANKVRDHVPLVTVKRTFIDQRTRKWEKKRVSNRIAQDKEKEGKLFEPIEFGDLGCVSRPFT